MFNIHIWVKDVNVLICTALYRREPLKARTLVKFV